MSEVDPVVLYEATLQVVPLLLISLFLDTKGIDGAPATRWARRWLRVQDRAFAVLGILAFLVSLFVVAGVAEPGRATAATVISTLSLAIGLLFARIWRRFDDPRTRDQAPPTETHHQRREGGSA